GRQRLGVCHVELLEDVLRVLALVYEGAFLALLDLTRRGASLAEVTSPSTAACSSCPSASTLFRSGSSRGPHVVEVEDGPLTEVVEVGGAGSLAGASSSSSLPAGSSSSSKMLSPISCTPAISRAEVVQGIVSSNVTSQVSTMRLVSRLSTR